MLERRTILAGAAATMLGGTIANANGAEMHGLIGQMLAKPGKRDELIALMLTDIGEMPGCLSYVVAKDRTNADAIWITEVWDSAESHRASLKLPAVQSVIARARPLIAGFGENHETDVVGGVGFPNSRT